MGFYRARSHQVVHVEHCLIQKPEADALAQAVRDYIARFQVPPYDEATDRGLLRHLYVRTSCRGESLACLLVNGSRLPHEEELVNMLRAAAPKTCGVVLGENTRRGNAILGDRYRTLWGRDYLTDTLCGLELRLSVPSFYQVNHDQAQRLYEKALEYAGLTGRELAVDLYCGAGTITQVLARRARHVIGGEIVPEAIRDAEESARRNGVENVEFLCGDASRLAAELRQRGLRPDVICVDPPRKGLAPDVVEAAASMEPERIVYVSCDPATLARDVARFAPLGYRPVRACAVDLFPGTANVETVVLLSHKKADSYIHIDVEFGEGEGKIPVDSIAKRAEAYKPKEKVTYKMIKEYIEAKYGFKVHTAYIAEVKRDLGLPMYDAPNAVEELKQPRKHPTPEKVEAIKDALRYFAVI